MTSTLATRPPRFRPTPLSAIVLVFVALGFVYSIVTPIFEASDELWHYPVIAAMVRENLVLPIQDAEHPALWRQEGSQPPLYYWVSAMLVRWIDHSDFATRRQLNPHGKAGVALATDNNAVIVHDWGAEAFPWRNTALAVHIVRFFGVLLGAVTVWLSYHIARLAVPAHPTIHVTTALLVAFNPMFLFIAGSVNNDNLINALAAAIMVLLLVIWRKGFSWRRLTVLAVLLALGSLTKLSGLTFYPSAMLVLWLVCRRERRPLRHFAWGVLLILAVWAILAGWWYWRNFVLYGDPTGLNVMVEIAGPRGDLPTLAQAWAELKGFRSAFWGWFGALNVLGPSWLFAYGDALTLASIFGVALYFFRMASTRGTTPAKEDQDTVVPLLLLLFQIAVVSVGVLNWTRRTYASQGRLLFPVLGPLMTLAAVGVYTLLANRRRFTPLVAGPLMVAAIAIPFTTIAPRYAPPPTVAALPEDAIAVDAQFGNIALVGVNIDDRPIAPGDDLIVTLYWRASEPTIEPLSFFVQVFGLEDTEGQLQQIGKLDSYPGGGLLSTTTWKPERIYQDTYRIAIDATARTPVQPVLKIGWWNYATRQEIPPTQPDGTPRAPVLVHGGRLVGNAQHLEAGTPAIAVFGGALRLNRCRLTPNPTNAGSTVQLRLEWEALTRVQEDFTVLVHLLAPEHPNNAPPLAQGDSPPLGGRWPTSAWVANVPFVDSYTLALPETLRAGEYRIAVGFYRARDFTRLSVETDLETRPGAVVLPCTLRVE